eukprot:611646-Pelagomonas_calceolata.AAC.1
MLDEIVSPAADQPGSRAGAFSLPTPNLISKCGMAIREPAYLFMLQLSCPCRQGTFAPAKLPL